MCRARTACRLRDARRHAVRALADSASAFRNSSWVCPFVAITSIRNGSNGPPSAVVRVPPASATSTAPGSTSHGQLSYAQ